MALGDKARRGWCAFLALNNTTGEREKRKELASPSLWCGTQSSHAFFPRYVQMYVVNVTVYVRNPTRSIASVPYEPCVCSVSLKNSHDCFFFCLRSPSMYTDGMPCTVRCAHRQTDVDFYSFCRGQVIGVVRIAAGDTATQVLRGSVSARAFSLSAEASLLRDAS